MSPDLLDQSIVELLRPLAFQELADLIAACGELRAIAPARVFGVDEYHAIRVACIPGVFRHAGLLRGRFVGEGWQRRTRLHASLLRVRNDALGATTYSASPIGPSNLEVDRGILVDSVVRRFTRIITGIQVFESEGTEG